MASVTIYGHQCACKYAVESVEIHRSMSIRRGDVYPTQSQHLVVKCGDGTEIILFTDDPHNGSEFRVMCQRLTEPSRQLQFEDEVADRELVNLGEAAH